MRCLLLALVLVGCASPVDVSDVDVGDAPVGESTSGVLTAGTAAGVDAEVVSVTLIGGAIDEWTVDVAGDLTAGAPEQTLATVSVSPRGVGRVDATVEWVFLASGERVVRRSQLRARAVGDALDRDGDGFTTADGDCDDLDATVHPDAEELACDGKDTDCSDGGRVPVAERDEDRDGFAACDGDCDDLSPEVRPGATEVCSGEDRDCDGRAGIADTDGDGSRGCDGDCDDGDPLVHPGAVEQCDAIDRDCSGAPGDVDLDGDGFDVCSSAPDCDDGNSRAHPVIVDPSVPRGGDGTPRAPYATLADAVDGLDTRCRTIYLRDGDHDVGAAIGVPRLRVAATGPIGARVLGTLPGAMFTPTGSGVLELDGLDIELLGPLADAYRDAVEIVDCRLQTGGDYLVQVTDGSLVVERSTVSGVAGTAIRGEDAFVISAGSLWLDNQTAIDLDSTLFGSAVLEVSGSLFRGHTASAIVAGANLPLDRVEITDSTFVENLGTEGGAAFVRGEFLIQRVDLLDNEAAVRGGGLVLESGPGIVRNLTAAGNTAPEGGALYLQPSSSRVVEVRRSTFAANEAGSGAAVKVFGGEPVVIDSVIAAGDQGPHFSGFAHVGWTTTWGADATEFGEASGPGNEHRDPLFVEDYGGEHAAWSPTLREDSPERGSGRPVPEFPDGSRDDRGVSGGACAAEGECL